MAGFTKFVRSQNSRFLIKSSVFWFSWRMETIFFKTKKNTHPDWALVVTQKVSVQNNEVSSFARGKTFHRFWVLGFQKLLEGGIWEFCAYDNFCSTPQDLSSLTVLKIFVQPFLKNPGNGGGALNMNMWVSHFSPKGAALTSFYYYFITVIIIARYYLLLYYFPSFITLLLVISNKVIIIITYYRVIVIKSNK